MSMPEPHAMHPVECIWCHSEHLISLPPNDRGAIYTTCRVCGIHFWQI